MLFSIFFVCIEEVIIIFILIIIMITIIIIAFLIFRYSVSTERGRLEDEAGCNAIVWFTQVAIIQWFIDQLVLRGQRGKGKGWVCDR